ncbi:hypothetical protein MAR_032527 [Mya arenaria]|uniref:C2H2-type domain-containing protein n=1 Tax=Mya arenaria TaxID=6604 RepID=A0ABY7FB70_MYAAR|nr:hypothetical protein MAR_032527 [Mya arenaria]
MNIVESNKLQMKPVPSDAPVTHLCAVCGKSFLWNHSAYVHMENRSCEICGRKFGKHCDQRSHAQVKGQCTQCFNPYGVDVCLNHVSTKFSWRKM